MVLLQVDCLLSSNLYFFICRPEYTQCVCSEGDRGYFYDEGYVTLTDLLPVTSFSLQDTGSNHEMAAHTFGPLVCLSGWYFNKYNCCVTSDSSLLRTWNSKTEAINEHS